MKVVISDRDANARRLLCTILGRMRELNIVHTCQEPESAFDAIDRMRADLAFIDASALGRVGSHRFKAASRSAAIILVSDEPSDAFLAYENEAIDYLVRPYQSGRVIAALRKVARMRRRVLSRELSDSLSLTPQFSEQLVFGQGQSQVTVDADRILYVVAQRNYVELNTSGTTHVVRSTLCSVLARLGQDSFVKANRSVAVRRQAVRGIELFAPGQYSVSLVNGARIRLSRNYRKVILESVDQPRMATASVTSWA